MPEEVVAEFGPGKKESWGGEDRADEGARLAKVSERRTIKGCSKYGAA